jgi:L-alanine-DL-glutamate epimerase-like enolase superfamily enzyme
MLIKRVEITPCMMPRKDKDWLFALDTTGKTGGWIVRIIGEGGQMGYGYAQAVPHLGAGFHAVKAALDSFVPLLEGRDPFAIDARLADLDFALLDNHQAKAGIDCALHDLKARALGVPVYELLGGKIRDSISQLRILPIKAPAEMAVNGQRLVDEGYRYLKIKVHGHVTEDVERVRAVRKQVGPEIHLTIDANQSYDPKSAIQAIRRMEEFGIDLVEQPVPIDDFKGLELVTHSVDTVIEADESARSLTDVLTLASHRMVDAISIKIPKLGGLRRARTVADICSTAGVKFRVGAAMGSRLLAAACIHFAAATPGIWYACELAQFEELLDDPFEGLEVSDGEIRVPDAAGLGVRRRE